MILKKPYAFLIKHFKIIHLGLLLFIIYITINFQKILSFFSEYSSSTNFVGEVAAKTYVPAPLFIAVAIVIIFSILMFLLMKQKNKPSLFYLLSTAYYALSIASFGFVYNLIKSLEFGTLDDRTILAYRDIFTIMFIVNFFFIIVSFIRGIGFDVKKFNFSKDLEDLEISSKDNEEFEFVLGNNTYKYKRKVRRMFRELKYYFAENKFFITIFGGILIGGITLFLILNVTLINRRYSIGSTLKTDQFNYKLNNAYVSAYNISGQKIKKGKKYLILDMFISCNNKNGGVIEPTKFYIIKGETVYNYKTSFSESFKDLGNSYVGNKINPEGNDFIFIFELDDSIKGSYILRVFDEYKYDKNGNQTYRFKDFDIIPEKIDYDLNKSEKTLNTPITFTKSIFGTTTLTIKEANISSSYTYTYQSCDNNNENCYKIYDVQVPNSQGENNLLTISYELNIDKNSQVYKAIGDDSKKFFDKFLKVSFVSGKTTYLSSIESTSNKNIDGYIFADIPKTIKKDSNTKLVISTRAEYYTIAL